MQQHPSQQPKIQQQKALPQAKAPFSNSVAEITLTWQLGQNSIDLAAGLHTVVPELGIPVEVLYQHVDS
ncbi:hypothetical protein SARC_12137 [Sphaeroforma arctica JP610]|uniref:Uncharacterized protein n=1 Tax=Sphaeroforma arctica JP610 TaxID=667725 RepID=A0A0L0FF07_9EUKA|nr:hypothetical protein SARC_12137 [Sphaeroforma arctica JP610]KNC75335.1 hypothetical protein SARC_12137 [Sphaeroforma arctica JP610]|eukprot:XP_014149237.1 hypothetical protein SARC_12137 [Sphaeroforma arctica JP610]